jgi:hypothetical protein
MHSSVCGAQISQFHFQKSSGYEAFDPALAKFEQSATTDLPLQQVIVNGPIQIQMHTRKHAAKNAAGRAYVFPHKNPFEQNPAQHLKRTAIALAALEPASFAEQAATMGCLPAFAAKISFRQKTDCAASAPEVRRRQLLPAPKTAFLPAGDPAELREIIKAKINSQSSRIENARATARLNVLSLAQAQAISKRQQLAGLKIAFDVTAFIGGVAINTFAIPTKFVKNRLGHLLGDLIDRLALA